MAALKSQLKANTETLKNMAAVAARDNFAVFFFLEKYIVIIVFSSVRSLK